MTPECVMYSSGGKYFRFMLELSPEQCHQFAEKVSGLAGAAGCKVCAGDYFKNAYEFLNLINVNLSYQYKSSHRGD